ncbi:MAG: calcium/sodium antiporter [Balneolaceae bacterium]
MALTIFWFIIGLVSLIGGAELLVRSASKLAASVGISKLVIGLTVVAFGTSAPELAVGIDAMLQGKSDIMLGNVVGSNLANTMLILGLGAILTPLAVHRNLLRFDLPVMIGSVLLLYALMWNGVLTRLNAMVLLMGLAAYLFTLFRLSGSKGVKVPPSPGDLPVWQTVALVIAGLVLLIGGARALVFSASEIAVQAGISELVIGLTMVAIGTSLPEVVITVAAALRGERDMLVGGIVGSNILNILAVVSISGLFAETTTVSDTLLRVDMVLLTVVSLICIPIFVTRKTVGRAEGAFLLLSYVGYVTWLFVG